MAKRIRVPGTAAIYARVSTERQARGDKTSIPRQIKNCRVLAATLGLTVNEQYVIEDKHSASDPEDREKLNRLQEAAERKHFQYVLFDVIDRTTRAGVFDFVDIVQRFLRFGVEPIWTTHPDLDFANQDDQKTAIDLAHQAYKDKETIARRFQEGKTERIKDGHLIRSFLSYGWRWNADKPRFLADYEDDADPRNAWVLDEGEDSEHNTARIARRIFMYLANGWRTNGDASASKIVDQLIAEGIPTPSLIKKRRRLSASWGGKPAQWSVGMITYMVHNPSYKGKRPQNRWIENPRDSADRRAKGLKTTRKLEERPESEWVYVDVPAIVDEQTWEDANSQLARNPQHNHRSPRRFTTDEVLLYGGYVRCALCGYSMPPRQNNLSPKGRWFYCCSRRARTEIGRCPGVKIPTAKVDALLWREACQLIRNKAYLRSLLDRTDEVWSPDTQIAHYDSLLADCDAEDRRIAANLRALGTEPALDKLRALIDGDAKENAAKRAKWEAKRELALADKERSTRPRTANPTVHRQGRRSGTHP